MFPVFEGKFRSSDLGIHPKGGSEVETPPVKSDNLTNMPR